jgi:hypothetical protein
MISQHCHQGVALCYLLFFPSCMRGSKESPNLLFNFYSVHCQLLPATSTIFPNQRKTLDQRKTPRQSNKKHSTMLHPLNSKIGQIKRTSKPCFNAHAKIQPPTNHLFIFLFFELQKRNPTVDYLLPSLFDLVLIASFIFLFVSSMPHY